MIIRQKSFARAGLIGNPSDGYFGKTIAFIQCLLQIPVNYEEVALDIMRYLLHGLAHACVDNGRVILPTPFQALSQRGARRRQDKN